MDDSLSPVPATTAEEAMESSQDAEAVGCSAGETDGAVGGAEPGEEAEAWAAALPPVGHFAFASQQPTFLAVLLCYVCGGKRCDFKMNFCCRNGCPLSDRTW